MKNIILIICLAILVSCGNDKKDYAPVKMEIAQNEVVVNEVDQTTDYTYLLVQQADKEYWIAVSKTEAKVGDRFYFLDAMEMNNFESKELNKVFDKILFVDHLSKDPIDVKDKKEAAISKVKKEMQQLLDSIKISPVEGGYSIGELYENANNYNTEKVIVRGQVVKINMDIMDRNWVHLMDGTKGADRSDLTVTTKEIVKIGDTVTFEGTLNIDREFGAGYVYPMIIEDAVLRN